MARIKLEMPATNSLADISIPVRITDINYGNHVGNDAFVAMIHEARVQWLKQHTYTELNFAGVGLIMSELIVEFKNESFYGDVIGIKIFTGEISRVGFELYYQLTAKRNEAVVILANAKTGMVCFDYEKKKTVLVNEEIKKILTG